MPRFFDPQAVARFVLDGDTAHPITWLSRYLTVGQRDRVAELSERARKDKDEAQTEKLIREAFAIGLIGWEAPAGFTRPAFSADAMAEVLTVVERWDLLNEWPWAVSSVELAQKKASSSPSPSATATPAASAGTAGPASA